MTSTEQVSTALEKPSDNVPLEKSEKLAESLDKVPLEKLVESLEPEKPEPEKPANQDFLGFSNEPPSYYDKKPEPFAFKTQLLKRGKPLTIKTDVKNFQEQSFGFLAFEEESTRTDILGLSFEELNSVVNCVEEGNFDRKKGYILGVMLQRMAIQQEQMARRQEEIVEMLNQLRGL